MPKMEDKPESFFSKLHRLTRQLETGISELQTRVEENMKDEDEEEKAVRILQEKKTQVRQLKADTKTYLDNFTESGKKFTRIIEACQMFIDAERGNLDKTESYLSSYGYVKQVAAPCENDTDEDAKDEDEDEDKEEESDKLKTPPKNGKKPESDSSTPKLEDFGISSFGLQMLSKISQNKPVHEIMNISNKTADVKPRARREFTSFATPCMNRHDSVPSRFQNSGITVTPSVMGMSQWPLYTPDSSIAQPTMKNNLYQSDGCFSPAPSDGSPVHPDIQTPAFKLAYKEGLSKPGFNQNSPLHCGDKDVKRNEGMPSYNNNVVDDSDEEPEPPTLSMTFHEMSQLKNFNYTEPKVPVSMTDRLGVEFDNDTPPALELLSTRLQALKEKTAHQNQTGHQYKNPLDEDDTPPPLELLSSKLNKLRNDHSKLDTPPGPTLLGKYGFKSDQENMYPY